MVLSWTVSGSRSTDTVATDITNAVAAHRFVNRFQVFANHLIANVDRGYTSDELILLASDLNALATGRFTFAMYLVPKGNFAWFSSDLASKADTFDAIARY